MASAMQRTSSMCSLPSPPADSRMDLSEGEEEEEVTHVNLDHPQNRATLPRRVQKRSHTMVERDEDEEEVDELDSDVEEQPSSDEPLYKKRNTSKRLSTLMLGSPVNVSTSTSSRASRKQLLNPFFLSAAPKSSDLPRQHPSSSTVPSSSTSSSSAEHSASITSPTRHSRRRVDPDRIKFGQNVTPPQKTRSQLQDERARQEAEEARARKREMMGWDDPDNPFLDKNDEMFKRNQTKGEVKRPETLTYVKRGERIKTSIPFTAVLTSSSPSEDPFTYTTPRLLFPPAPPKVPTTPPSSFLQALRASSSTSTTAPPQEATQPTLTNKPVDRTAELPPTPVTMKRKKPTRSFVDGSSSTVSSGAGTGYKKLKLPNSEAQHQYQHQHRNGLRQ